MAETFDILIIGGGPAGLSTALHLARYAPHLLRRMAILEKAHYPRPKLCAGGLTIDAERMLERLGLDTNEIPHVDLPELRFGFERSYLTLAFPGRHALRVVRRDEFDAWLATQAKRHGVTLYEGIKVTGLRRDTETVTVLTDQGEWSAKVVVGADGANGITRRTLLATQPVPTARTLEALLPCEKGNHDNEAGKFEFSCLAQGIAGYIWDFPTQVNGQAAHCWGIYDNTAAPRQPQVRLRQAVEQAVGATISWQSHPIRLFTPWQAFSAPRVLLVGDAAGVDGLFGEGISLALGYGEVAARTLLSAFEQANFAFTSYRARLLASPLGQTLLLRWGIAQIFYRLPWPPFQRAFWKWLRPLILWVAKHGVLNWSAGL